MMEQQPGLDSLLQLRRQADADVINVDESTRKFVIFALDKEWFAIAGENIREILPLGRIFFVPGCPPSLEGVINVRGDIESLISLSILLGRAASELPAGESILLGHGAGMQSGIRVGRVIDVVDVPESQVHAPHATLPENMKGIVCGLMLHKEIPVTILDLNTIFEDYRRNLK
jgi:purine-binding chemotaxis protein CheW